MGVRLSQSRRMGRKLTVQTDRLFYFLLSSCFGLKAQRRNPTKKRMKKSRSGQTKKMRPDGFEPTHITPIYFCPTAINHCTTTPLFQPPPAHPPIAPTPTKPHRLHPFSPAKPLLPFPPSTPQTPTGERHLTSLASLASPLPPSQPNPTHTIPHVTHTPRTLSAGARVWVI